MNKSFRKIAGSLACWVPQGVLTRWSSQKMIFPYYHTVSDERLNHIRNVSPYRSISRFSKDLEYLLRHFHPAGIDEIKAWQKNPSSLHEPHFYLSFDDGLREVYETIAPILVEKGIPAVFFLNTDFIDNKDLFYRYKASLILDRLETVKYSPATSEILHSRFHLPGRDKRHIRSFILGVRYDRRSVLDEIGGILDLDFSAFLKVRKPYMSKAQVLELRDQGFSIGAHGQDHAEFSLLNSEGQLEQFSGSLEFVRREFRQDQGLFAFPFSDEGVSEAFFESIWQSGELMATFGTAGLKKDTVPFHHQRIPMEILRLPAGMTIKGEFMYYLLKSIFSKNTRQR